VRAVVGVDGSEASEGALRWAVDEARLHQGQVVAIHAWEAPVAPVDLLPVPHPDFVALLSDLRAAAEQLVASSVEKVTGREPPVPVERLAIEGPAATVLLDAAADADLLVLGSRGRGGFVGLLLGSVTRQCVDHAPCPVLVHRPLRRA
jgi:nucleotide-binding universal stress UspA family protein